jgi:hypothetical protein
MPVPDPSPTFKPWRKVLGTIALVAVLLLSSFGTLDSQGSDYTSDGIKRAAIAFGIARALNGVISVAQGTELSLQPAGVGLNLAPGQILDPINDLVEQFSDIMLLSFVSLTAQHVLLTKVTSWTGFVILLGIFLVLYIINFWSPKKFLPSWFYNMLIIFVFARMAAPVMAMANESFFKLFLADRYEQTLAGLQQTTVSLDDASKDSDDKKGQSFGEWFSDMFESTSDSLNIEKRLEMYKKVASDLSYQVVDMVVIFIVQTVIFPLLFLWMMVKLARRLFQNQ